MFRLVLRVAIHQPSFTDPSWTQLAKHVETCCSFWKCPNWWNEMFDKLGGNSLAKTNRIEVNRQTIWLVVEPTPLKNESKWESSPNRGVNKKYLSCHHLVNYKSFPKTKKKTCLESVSLYIHHSGEIVLPKPQSPPGASESPMWNNVVNHGIFNQPQLVFLGLQSFRIPFGGRSFAPLSFGIWIITPACQTECLPVHWCLPVPLCQ